MADQQQPSTSSSSNDVANIIPEGRVGQVCKEWLVREDGNLAYRLQNEEIAQHYNENRSKNQIVRKDIPLAKHLQQNEILEAQKKYERILQEQLEHDERVARRIERKLWLEEEAAKRAAEEADEKLAKKLMEKEKAKQLKKRLQKEQQQVEKLSAQIGADYTIQPSTSSQCGPRTLERITKPTFHRIMTEDEQELDLSEFCMPPPPGLTPEELKYFLEEQDAEIARLLQNQELKRSRNPEKEKLALIEAQDFEIAKMLQKMEKERYKRIKEKLRNQQLQKSQSGSDQDSNFRAELQSDNSSYQRTSTPLTDLNSTTINKVENEYDIPENHLTNPHDQTYEEPSNVLANTNSPETVLAQNFHNIAIDLDPTYKRRSGMLPKSSSHGNLIETGVDNDDEQQRNYRQRLHATSSTSSSRSSDTHTSSGSRNHPKPEDYAPPLPPRDVSLLMSKSTNHDHHHHQAMKADKTTPISTSTFQSSPPSNNLLPPHHPQHPNRQYNESLIQMNPFIQGQRRISSMEKQQPNFSGKQQGKHNHNKSHQDGCRTQ